MAKNLTFKEIYDISIKEKASGIYCYEANAGTEITNISQLNESNSTYVSNDIRIQKNYKIIDYLVISKVNYQCRFNGGKIPCPTPIGQIMLVWVEKIKN